MIVENKLEEEIAQKCIEKLINLTKSKEINWLVEGSSGRYSTDYEDSRFVISTENNPKEQGSILALTVKSKDDEHFYKYYLKDLDTLEIEILSQHGDPLCKSLHLI